MHPEVFSMMKQMLDQFAKVNARLDQVEARMQPPPTQERTPPVRTKLKSQVEHVGTSHQQQAHHEQPGP